MLSQTSLTIQFATWLIDCHCHAECHCVKSICTDCFLTVVNLLHRLSLNNTAVYAFQRPKCLSAIREQLDRHLDLKQTHRRRGDAAALHDVYGHGVGVSQKIAHHLRASTDVERGVLATDFKHTGGYTL